VSEQELKKKIQQLEMELAQKDQDLKIYKKELSEANVELEKLIVRVNDQLQQSLKIQKFLVPTEFPNIQGFEFSTKFSSSSVSGGDYFDIFEHYDKMRFGLFLSSASGYGMSALFLSVLMKMTYQIEDSKNYDPTKVMTEIVEELESQAGDKDQAAIFYGVFDRRKFELTYCNVGQPLAIYYQAETGRLELLQGPAEPFSKEKQNLSRSLENRSIELNPKDKLIFCSLGFLELVNDQGDLWGIDEILSIVKLNVNKDVHGLRNEIFYQASKFSSQQPRDLTVIVTEVKDRIMKLA
jgi:sigma-B regulation protein RsbU (phosphoserine phosphatase)